MCQKKTKDFATDTSDSTPKNKTVGESRNGLLTDVLNLDESVQNCEFMQLFTSQGVSTSYNNYDYDYDLHVPQNSQLRFVDNANFSDTKYIDNIDSQLQNLPKEIYISKLLELFSEKESKVLWYRNVLFSSRLPTR